MTAPTLVPLLLSFIILHQAPIKENLNPVKEGEGPS
jgi:hypothetical protein